jgi:hypothetical protein
MLLLELCRIRLRGDIRTLNYVKHEHQTNVSTCLDSILMQSTNTDLPNTVKETRRVPNGRVKSASFVFNKSFVSLHQSFLLDLRIVGTGNAGGYRCVTRTEQQWDC